MVEHRLGLAPLAPLFLLVCRVGEYCGNLVLTPLGGTCALTYPVQLFSYFLLHFQISGPLVKCLQCHDEAEMHELRHHVEEVHGKSQKVGLLQC